MLINLRGTNGSGKTTVIKSMLTSFPQRALFGALGPKYPEAYELSLPGKSLFVIGPYHSRTGGIDALSGRGFDLIVNLLGKYSTKGHVLFEGVVISTSFGAVGEWLLAAHKKDSIVAFLDTPLEVCLSSITKRTGDTGRSKHVQEKFKSITRVKQTMVERGLRVETVTRDNAVASIKTWLGVE